MAEETLTINDAVFIFPTDFIQSIAAQQSGESLYWTAEEQLQNLRIETYREKEQLRLAVKSLKLWIKDGFKICLLKNIVKSNKSSDFHDFTLKQNKHIASFCDAFLSASLKNETKSEKETTSAIHAGEEPKRKRGRPRKTEAEKQNKKTTKICLEPNLDNKYHKRYTLRGVKLSAEIMNAEKGIYHETKKSNGAPESSSMTTSGKQLTDSEYNEKVAENMTDSPQSKSERKENIAETSDVNANVNNCSMTDDGDSDDDFIPAKKRKRGRPKLLHRKHINNKSKKRSLIDIGDVPRSERRKRNNEKREECRMCRKKYCDYTGLFDHVKKKHEKMEGYQSYLDQLKELMVSACSVCGQKFGNRTLLQAHEDREHRQSAIVECFRCKKSFRNIVNLRNHVRAVHVLKGAQSKLCHLCPAKFKWAATLKQHLDEIHEGNKHAKCQICAKMFYSNSQLRRHERCHGLHQSKFAVCQQCGRKFLFAHNLKRHVETMHGTREEIYHCSYCGRGYHTKTSMISHVQLLHFNLYSYTCKLCQSTFPRSKFLVDHMMSVHKVANFQVTENPRDRYKYKKNTDEMIRCTYCGKGFHYKAKMVAHIHTVHADLFPHRCDICQQGFLEASFLYNHRLKAHGIEPTNTDDSLVQDGTQELNSSGLVTCTETYMGAETVGIVVGSERENSQTLAIVGTGDGSSGVERIESTVNGDTSEQISDSAAASLLAAVGDGAVIDERTEPTMSDTAAASLLVEVASGTKTYRYYIETQEGVEPGGAVTVDPHDIANLLLMAEQTIQEETGSVGSQQEMETLVVEGMEPSQQGVESVIVQDGDPSHEGVESLVVQTMGSNIQEAQSVIVQEVESYHQGVESLIVQEVGSCVQGEESVVVDTLLSDHGTETVLVQTGNTNTKNIGETVIGETSDIQLSGCRDVGTGDQGEVIS